MGVKVLKMITSIDDQELHMLINEFIVVAKLDSIESTPIEFLKFLREKQCKIEDTELFSEACSLIDKKYFR